MTENSSAAAEAGRADVPEAAAGEVYAEVAVAVPVYRLFTYRVPPRLVVDAVPGRRVSVPFGPRSATGYLVALLDGPPAGVAPGKVKDVHGFLDSGPLLDPPMLALGRFVARWYASSVGEALDAALPAAVKSGGKRRRIPVIALAVPEKEARAAAARLAPKNAKRARILLALVENEGRMPQRELLRVTHSGPSPLRTMEKAGLLKRESVEAVVDPFSLRRPVEIETAPPPTDAQAAALTEITAAIDAAEFRVFLLLGITGSGKTEVYLRALAETIARGRQAVVMVPEIALTPQTVQRFRARCPRVAVLHSALSDAERHSQWKRIRAGEADVVIGPRSAVFAPVPRLGLVVLDEEHETSFKQQNSPRYHARDVGIVRARDAGAVVLLGSATPSLETYAHALDGRYGLLRLPTRVGSGRLPPVEVVDMRQERRDTGRPLFLSRRLEELLRGALERKEQGLLFLNRRGYATSVSCGRCDFVLECEACAVAYTLHRRLGLGLCHYCGGEIAVPEDCPSCRAPGLRRKGAGTEKIEEAMGVVFPDARIARMDSDTMKGRESYEKVLDAFRAREIDLLVGTQMIAKGLDFPMVTVVGVLNADIALHVPDFRAAERTFQLLAQVAGRAGRAERPGRVVVQTNMPEHPAVVAAARHDFEGFAGAELEERRAMGYPPQGRLLFVMASATKQRVASADALAVAEAVRRSVPAAEVLGPAPALHEQVKGRMRWHVLVKAPDAATLQRAVAAVLPLARRGREREVMLDVDPMGTA